MQTDRSVGSIMLSDEVWSVKREVSLGTRGASAPQARHMIAADVSPGSARNKEPSPGGTALTTKFLPRNIRARMARSAKELSLLRRQPDRAPRAHQGRVRRPHLPRPALQQPPGLQRP